MPQQPLVQQTGMPQHEVACAAVFEVWVFVGALVAPMLVAIAVSATAAMMIILVIDMYSYLLQIRSIYD